MDRLDLLLMIVAGYVAVVSLVRLMANRRNDLVAKIRVEIEKQRAEAAEAAATAAQEHDEAA
jgi:F0F1-type ATP synthase membrane subunit b/b'